MGFKGVLAGTNRRDQLTAQALREANAAKNQGLTEFTITVHSTHGGLALLPRLTTHVIKQLQANGFGVVNVTNDDWAYNSHIVCRSL